MVHPEGCRLLHQIALDAILKHPDNPFYLPVGFAIANSNVVADDAQPFEEPCKAAHKLTAIIYLDVMWFSPTRLSYKNSVALQLCSKGTV